MIRRTGGMYGVAANSEHHHTSAGGAGANRRWCGEEKTSASSGGRHVCALLAYFGKYQNHHQHNRKNISPISFITLEQIV